MKWPSRLLNLVRARPRLFLALGVVLATGLALPDTLIHQSVTRWLVAWNCGTDLYVLLAALMMRRATEAGMRTRARLQDDGKATILLLVVVATVASVAAIGFELTVVKDLQGAARQLHVALAGMTVVSSWAFTQVAFALHYAHEYYLAATRHQPPGLQFPDDVTPDYGDFFYVSAVVGTSGQTADVSFSSRPMRRIATVHCILAYLFNTTVLALLINIAASLL